MKTEGVTSESTTEGILEVKGNSVSRNSMGNMLLTGQGRYLRLDSWVMGSGGHGDLDESSSG